MLAFERRAVAALTTARDDDLRRAVDAYVDGSLRAMPDFLRIGVAVESAVLGAWSRVLVGSGGRAAPLRGRLGRWESGPIGPVRQWARLMRSLVLYAENELPRDGS